MAEVSYSVTIHAPADAVWRTVRAFSGLETYFSAFVSSSTEGEGEGATRVLRLADGGEFLECLESLDDDSRTLVYKTMKSPLPIKNYVGTVRVEEAGAGRAKVTWSCRFDADAEVAPAMIAMFKNAYADGIQGLERLNKA
jgi:mxaD protein